VAREEEKFFGAFIVRSPLTNSPSSNLDRPLQAADSRVVTEPFRCFSQDYLGAIIVFIAVLTALISSYLLPDEASPSLVGLALQYSLLIPIYLNWVVKLYADMEMYFGACERISYYIENCYHEEQQSPAVVCKFPRIASILMYCRFKIYLCLEDEPLPAHWPQHGSIEFRKVSLKHPAQDESFIADLNLTIPTGQRVSCCRSCCLFTIICGFRVSPSW
jgi:ABC-type multidrug transport system fused ATPase/permease subunit